MNEQEYYPDPICDKGTRTMSEIDLIELLLLQNRGCVDAPELSEFDPILVTEVYLNILREGYLRTLGSIQAMEPHPGHHGQYVFSPSGRIRFHQLERMRDAASGDSR